MLYHVNKCDLIVKCSLQEEDENVVWMQCNAQSGSHISVTEVISYWCQDQNVFKKFIEAFSK